MNVHPFRESLGYSGGTITFSEQKVLCRQTALRKSCTPKPQCALRVHVLSLDDVPALAALGILCGFTQELLADSACRQKPPAAQRFLIETWLLKLQPRGVLA